MILGLFIVFASGFIIGGIFSLIRASRKIDEILHYEVELDNGYICHECGQAYPCPTLVETRS
jgi:hypothetical protein